MADDAFPEALDRDQILGGLSGTARGWLVDLLVFEQIHSTNTHLVDLAQREDISGRVCLAEQQTAGRGRRGRAWLSPVGRSIALSIGMRFDTPGEALHSLSLVVGVAVADAVSGFDVPEVRLKWPNDILLGHGKLGGILIELVDLGDQPTVVIGVGLNVGSGAQIQGQVDQPVADLLEAAPRISRNALASALINSIVDYCREFEDSGFGPIRDTWLGLHAYQDCDVEIVIGNRAVRGKVRGVTHTGELELESEGRLLRFNSGEVSLRPRPN
jgi:BirA family biotin operon repressor/biotin-[acetyl-CoA-carboxylase] ligase